MIRDASLARSGPGVGALGPAAAGRRRVRRRVNGTLVAAGLLLVLIVGVAALGPFLVPYDPEAFGPALQPPSWAHPFGTDNFGRDVATRVVYAAHLNLLIGLVPTA